MACSAFACGCTASGPSAPAEPPECAVSLRAAKDSFRQGAPLVFTVTLKNISGRTYSVFDVEFAAPACIHFIDAASGRRWNVHSRVRYGRTGAVSATLKPGETWTADILLDKKWGFQTGEGFRFRREEALPPARYKVFLELALEDPRRSPFFRGVKKDFWAKKASAGPATITVTKR